MNTAVSQISIQDLPTDVVVDGYYWYSDQEKPQVVRRGLMDPAWFTDLPFVVEARFYSSIEQLSFSIDHIDGRYRAFQFDLSAIDKGNLKKITHIAHDLEGIKSFEVLQAWEPVSDPLLEGMQTLKRTWEAFGGF